MQRVVITYYRRFGTTYRSHCQGSSFLTLYLPLSVGPIGYPKTSVRNYRCTLRNIREERRSLPPTPLSGQPSGSAGRQVSIRAQFMVVIFQLKRLNLVGVASVNPYPTAFPYGNGMVLHFYQQQESSTTKTVHKVINKGLKTYV